MEIRNAEPADYPSIIPVLNDWWGGRRMSDMLPRLFFAHFRETSFVAKEDAQMVGFLSGFFSQTFADEAYIHFVGVHPDYRKRGLGQALYERFFETVRGQNRNVVRCVTSPVNKISIAFHTRLGFQIEPRETRVDGVPFYPDYDGEGEDRVLFVKHLSKGAG